jgi:hypothetical protein
MKQNESEPIESLITRKEQGFVRQDRCPACQSHPNEIYQITLDLAYGKDPKSVAEEYDMDYKSLRRHMQLHHIYEKRRKDPIGLMLGLRDEINIAKLIERIAQDNPVKLLDWITRNDEFRAVQQGGVSQRYDVNVKESVVDKELSKLTPEQEKAIEDELAAVIEADIIDEDEDEKPETTYG